VAIRNSPFYLSSERKWALVREAQSWLKTPVVPHGAMKGAAVDCVSFLAEVYVATGLMPDYPRQEQYAMDAGSHMDRSKLEAMITATGCFDLVWQRREDQFKQFIDLRDEIFAGDCLCLCVGRVTHHVALAMGGTTIIHAIAGPGVAYGDILDSTIARRIDAIYRPVATTPFTDHSITDH
jgi:cell wall-associated NlpC family hydrolase